ncbi:hypothetical protein [Aeromicrobium phoceense]|uniref:hypothetical protein n=1 Tax=Aeromicrobium phoceense TaxID=2754045 RepID=UPI0019D59E3A|nr:hypothetical protein [Aeromicrobium phoceense]
MPPFAEHTVELARLDPAPEEIRQRWDEVIEAGGGAMPRFLPGDPRPSPSAW